MNLFRSIALLGLVSAAGAAMADPLSISGMTSGKYYALNIAVYGGNINCYAGPQSATYGTDNFEAYCVDIFHDNYLPVSFDVTPKSASTFLPNGDRIAQLVNKYSSTITNADQGAALQLAIWDVLVDGGDGINTGNFQASGVTAGSMSYVSSFLGDSLTGTSNLATVYNPTYHGPNDNIYQGMIGAGGPITNAVPEPASMAALAIGGLALLRRRRKSA
ncbi:hypothetical protein BH11ARM2_BH11ARM2_32690 [soil metagenome]